MWKDVIDPISGEQLYSDSQLGRVIPGVLSGDIKAQMSPQTLDFNDVDKEEVEIEEEIDILPPHPVFPYPMEEKKKINTPFFENHTISSVEGNGKYNIRRVIIGWSHSKSFDLVDSKLQSSWRTKTRSDLLDSFVEIHQIFKQRDPQTIFNFLLENNFVEERYKYELQKKLEKADIVSPIKQQISVPVPFLIKNQNAQIECIQLLCLQDPRIGRGSSNC